MTRMGLNSGMETVRRLKTIEESSADLLSLVLVSAATNLAAFVWTFEILASSLLLVCVYRQAQKL